MTKRQRNDYGEFISVLCRNSNGKVNNFTLAAELCNLAKKAQRYNELSCNYGLTDRQQKRADKIDQEVVAMGKAAGLEIEVNGDPRGYAFKVICPDGSSNSFCGQGWGIPTI